jgi:predicted lipid carrier protein YhbT
MNNTQRMRSRAVDSGKCPSPHQQIARSLEGLAVVVALVPCKLTRDSEQRVLSQIESSGILKENGKRRSERWARSHHKVQSW